MGRGGAWLRPYDAQRLEAPKRFLSGHCPSWARARTLLIPADCDPTLATKRELYDQRLRGTCKLAELEKEPGSLWHALRRKRATERKGYPVNDLAAAGGWRDTPTPLASYLWTDAETIMQVVLNPTMRLAAAR